MSSTALGDHFDANVAPRSKVESQKFSCSGVVGCQPDERSYNSVEVSPAVPDRPHRIGGSQP
jgi:hypothetical protein